MAVGNRRSAGEPAPPALWTGGSIRKRVMRPLSLLPGPVFLAFLRPIQFLYERSDGRITSGFLGIPFLVLRTTGRRSGRVRSVALLYVADGARLAVIASKGGAAKHPAWFENLRADPSAEVQVGRARWRVRARVVEGEERRHWWTLAQGLWDYDRYQRRTARQIPVVVLEPAS